MRIVYGSFQNSSWKRGHILFWLIPGKLPVVISLMLFGNGLHRCLVDDLLCIFSPLLVSSTYIYVCFSFYSIYTSVGYLIPKLSL